MRGTGALGLAGCLALLLAAAAPPALAEEAVPGAAAPAAEAGGAERGPVPPPERARITLRVKGASDGTLEVNHRVKAVARIRPFVRRQVMQIRFARSGTLIKRKNLRVRQLGRRPVGQVKLRSPNLLRPGAYRATAVHRRTPEQEPDIAKSRRFHPTYPDLDPGNRNQDVALFKDLLDRKGYYVGGGERYDDGTARAVMAFRKVNGMERTFNASPGIFRTLADGRGGFKLQHPGAGHHAEVDISRQVMVLAADGKVQHIFHVSTGTASTPSDRGFFRFFRKDPGYNSVGMYYSVYYNGGEATHGYKSVPTYPASHGCIRNPIPNSVLIYNWIHLGDPMIVYS